MKWLKFFLPVKSINANQAGKIINNTIDNNYIVVDVREPAEHAERHIKGSRLIPLFKISKRAGELDINKKILVYCRSGSRSKLAARILAVKGFKKVYNLKGGMK